MLIRAFFHKAQGVDEPVYFTDCEFGANWQCQKVTVFRFVRDALGSVHEIREANTDGLAMSVQYTAFGEPTVTRGPAWTDGLAVALPHAFTGREWDEEIGLYHYRARYYDPVVGRFLSEDPIGFFWGGELGRIPDYRTWDERHPRVYDSAVGALASLAFPSQTIGLQLNKYLYVKNSPAFYIDPSGENPMLALVVALVVAYIVLEGHIDPAIDAICK